MIFAHGDTPFHDDPAFWVTVAAFGSPAAVMSFGAYWVRRRFKR